MAELRYSGPKFGVKLLKELQAGGSKKLDFSVKITDAGFGSGPVGVALAELGYDDIEDLRSPYGKRR